jgi:transcriptional regulator with GAF, ATPase, and Fis domain
MNKNFYEEEKMEKLPSYRNYDKNCLSSESPTRAHCFVIVTNKESKNREQIGTCRHCGYVVDFTPPQDLESAWRKPPDYPVKSTKKVKRVEAVEDLDSNLDSEEAETDSQQDAGCEETVEDLKTINRLLIDYGIEASGFLSIKEAARELKLAAGTLYYRIKKGKIKTQKVRGILVIPEEEVKKIEKR